MSSVLKIAKSLPGLAQRLIVGGGKKEEVEPEDDTIGGAATEEELEAQRRKREQNQQRVASRGTGERPRRFGTILDGGRKFGG